MDTRNTKIITRVKNLLDMAADASSPNEAFIAAKRARLLMDKHQITQLDTEQLDDGQFMDASASENSSTRKKWMMILAGSVGRMNDCQATVTSHNGVTYSFRGLTNDATVAATMMNYLVRVCGILAKASGAKGRSEYTAYRMGFVGAICNRVEDLVAEREKNITTNGTGLIALKKKMISEHFNPIPMAKISRQTRDMTPAELAVFKRGNRDGTRAALDTAIAED